MPTPTLMPMPTTTIMDKRVTGDSTAYSCAKKTDRQTDTGSNDFHYKFEAISSHLFNLISHLFHTYPVKLTK